MSETPKTDDLMVAALLRERAGYVGRKGKEDRVEAVDEQLRLRGYSPDGERIPADGASDAPKARTAPTKQTAAQGSKTTTKQAAKKAAATPPAETPAPAEPAGDPSTESAPTPSAE